MAAAKRSCICTPEKIWDIVQEQGSQFIETVRESRNTAEEIKAGISHEYIPTSNRATLRQAQTLIDNVGIDAIRR